MFVGTQKKKTITTKDGDVGSVCAKQVFVKKMYTSNYVPRYTSKVTIYAMIRHIPFVWC